MAISERRSDQPGDARNWALDCGFVGCGLRFPSTQVMSQVASHWAQHAGQYTGRADRGEVEVADPEKPVLTLVWIGVGQPPKERPSWVN